MITKHHLILLASLLWVVATFGQELQRKQITVLRVDEPLKIDGILDETVYTLAEKASDFVQLSPYNGKPSYKPTEVNIFYDNNAIYIGAMLYDDPDSIQNYVTTRDILGISDYFIFFIDPNNEGLTGYEFGVTPANSQNDYKAVKSNSGDNEDSSWDAVWQSATNINEKGWSLELRIPYSALRFPAKKEPVWGVNFFRRIRRYNSNNSWNLVNSEIAGFIQQTGELHGLKNIKSPFRLSVSPYVASYAQHQSGDPDIDFLFKGGVDLKYGLSDSHTLDMMLIPDFGQIQSDDKELNLSPYEIYYDEKRQFFVEGAELFNRAEIFYSRRIGGKPKFSNIEGSDLNLNEKITFNPNETQLVNATKISGRDKNGWGIGFLNAMSLASKADITDTLTGITREMVTQPFTNYNVTLVEKALKNNSYFSLINTNITMANNPYRANVTGTEFQLKNNKQTYQLTGLGALSYRSIADDKTGYGYSLGIKKIKGKLRFLIDHDVKSSTFNPNDLGYLQRNNQLSDKIQVSYNIYEPFSIFKNWYAYIQNENTMLYSPNKQVENQLTFWTQAQFTNNWWVGLYLGRSFGIDDFYETRVENRYYKGPAHNMYEIDIRSDINKKFSWLFMAGSYVAGSNLPYGFWGANYFEWKLSSRFNIKYDLTTNIDYSNSGYVNHLDRDTVYFGRFDRHTFINTFSASYTFNTKMNVDFRGRHYWSRADYVSYFFLNANGTLKPLDSYPENSNVNFNAFTIDMAFKWEFAPGSELSLVWKNAIYTENMDIDISWAENITETLKAKQSNSLSLKVLYYIDINQLRKSR
jgi:hypothetical protein